MGFILLIVSLILTSIIGTISTIVTLGYLITTLKFWRALKLLDDLARSTAFGIDQLGNVMCKYLFNLTLIKREKSYKFGNPDKSISATLGENYVRGRLTKLGILIVRLLDWIDPDHVTKAMGIEDTEERFLDDLLIKGIISNETHELAKAYLSERELEQYKDIINDGED